MNATDSLLIPLFDAGRLSGLTGGPLGPRFRFWRDENGQRHIFSIYDADAAPDYPDALAIVARRTPAGPIAMWAGPAGEPARRAARRMKAEEVHVHVFGEDVPESLARFLEPHEPPPERLALPAPTHMMHTHAAASRRAA
ncbi:hypothetical protein V5F77_02210 [Xanthobacter sp. DSM 24535]|uniref:hypothetical protein n=1 Tax=Roseixanthobacter psychrophilus TaxID=3119917 RepID=UPI0037283CAD